MTGGARVETGGGHRGRRKARRVRRAERSVRRSIEIRGHPYPTPWRRLRVGGSVNTFPSSANPVPWQNHPNPYPDVPGTPIRLNPVVGGNGPQFGGNRARRSDRRQVGANVRFGRSTGRAFGKCVRGVYNWVSVHVSVLGRITVHYDS